MLCRATPCRDGEERKALVEFWTLSNLEEMLSEMLTLSVEIEVTEASLSAGAGATVGPVPGARFLLPP